MSVGSGEILAIMLDALYDLDLAVVNLYVWSRKLETAGNSTW